MSIIKERTEMEKPTSTSNLANVQEMIPFAYAISSEIINSQKVQKLTWLHVDVLPLSPQQINDNGRCCYEQTYCTTPPY